MALSIFEVLKKPDFRNRLESSLAAHNITYSIPGTIPSLYKYCGFSKYAIKNLLLDGLSLSLLSTFNDCYDSNISFGNIVQQASNEYSKDLRISTAAGIVPCISQEQWHQQITLEQEAYRGFCTDSHGMCLSEDSASTLMWSHYADSNRGMCIEYDFETIKDTPLYHTLFPICYTSAPIDVYDFIRNEKEDFSVELGVMISILNKATCWSYEREWRLVVLNGTMLRNTEKYISLNGMVKAKSITLGQSFLDNFIPESSKNDVEESFSQLEALIACSKAKSIPVYQIVPTQNSFEQNRRVLLQGNDLHEFVDNHRLDRDFALSHRNFLYTSYWQRLGIINIE